MFFDGAKNQSGCGIKVVLISQIGKHFLVSTKLRLLCSNNMADYEDCILGLRQVINLNVQEMLIIGDSDLSIHQVCGEWVTKNQKFFAYLECVHKL